MKELARATGVALTLVCAQSAGAGTTTLYDFSWSAESFSAAGTLELDGAVGVGDPFDSTNVLGIGIELFDGAVSVGTIGLSDFVPGSDVLEGTRNASSLSISDIFLTAFGINFGCQALGCVFGVVLFETPSTPSGRIDFGTAQAAQASFVFTQVPAPAPALGALTAAATLSVLGSRRRKHRAPAPRAPSAHPSASDSGIV